MIGLKAWPVAWMGNRQARKVQHTRTLYVQLLQSHRQLANALASSVKDRIAHRCIGADVGQLAESLDAGRVDMVVLLGKQDHLDARHICVHRHQVVGQIVIDVARIALVDFGGLVQR